MSQFSSSSDLTPGNLVQSGLRKIKPAGVVSVLDCPHVSKRSTAAGCFLFLFTSFPVSIRPVSLSSHNYINIRKKYLPFKQLKLSLILLQCFRPS